MPQITLTITTDTDTGSTNVAGPIDNKILAYGLLEQARDAIYDYNRKREESVIQMPQTGIVIPGTR